MSNHTPEREMESTVAKEPPERHRPMTEDWMKVLDDAGFQWAADKIKALRMQRDALRVERDDLRRWGA